MEEKKKSIKIRAREHWDKHKTKYIYGGVVVGVGVTCYIIGKRVGSETMSNNKHMVVNRVVGKDIEINQIDNSVNTVIQSIGRNGHPGVVVYCPELKKTFRSYGEAARETGISRNSISRVAKGKTEHANGLSFKILGDAQESTLGEKVS